MKMLKIKTIALMFLVIFGIVSVPVVFAQTSTSQDITNTVLEWMPLIITFAMLGMVLGMLKKFGRF